MKSTTPWLHTHLTAFTCWCTPWLHVPRPEQSGQTHIPSSSPYSYQGKEGMAPAAYLQRYHGPVTEASAPAQMVSSVKEAVQSVSASASLHKAAENRPKLQPTWHSQQHHSIDKERKPLSQLTPPLSSTCLSSFMSHPCHLFCTHDNIFSFLSSCYSHLRTYSKAPFYQGWFSRSHYHPNIALPPPPPLPSSSCFKTHFKSISHVRAGANPRVVG